MADYDGSPVCPDCNTDISHWSTSGGPPNDSKAPLEMPEATCPNRRHDTWRLAWHVPQPERAA